MQENDFASNVNEVQNDAFREFYFWSGVQNQSNYFTILGFNDISNQLQSFRLLLQILMDRIL